MHYRTLWVVRHVMPDDRLAHTSVDLDRGTIALALRHGKIHPVLANAMRQFSQAFARSNLYDLDPTRMPDVDRPELIAWFEAVDDHLLDGQPLQVFYGGKSPAFFNIIVDKSLVEPALLRELNEEVMPPVCGLLVPFGYADWASSR